MREEWKASEANSTLNPKRDQDSKTKKKRVRSAQAKEKELAQMYKRVFSRPFLFQSPKHQNKEQTSKMTPVVMVD